MAIHNATKLVLLTSQTKLTDRKRNHNPKPDTNPKPNTSKLLNSNISAHIVNTRTKVSWY